MFRFFYRRPLRRRWKVPTGHFQGKFWVYPLIMIIFLLIFILWMLERNIEPVLSHIAEAEVKKEAQAAITKGIKQQLTLGPKLNELMQIEKGADGKIIALQMNPEIQASIYTKTATAIENAINHLKDKPLQISLGQILQSAVFADFGPDIPVDIWQEGSTKISMEPKMESKGINMVMVTVNIRVETELGIIVPFHEKNITLTTDYPVAQTMVVGEVPEYYFYNDQGQMKQGTVQPTLPVPNKKH